LAKDAALNVIAATGYEEAGNLPLRVGIHSAFQRQRAKPMNRKQTIQSSGGQRQVMHKQFAQKFRATVNRFNERYRRR
jgi:hypothetical protein